MTYKTLSLFPLFIFTGALCLAGDLVLLGTSDKPSALYEPGEKMVFTLRLEKDGQPVTGTRLTWTRTGDDGLTEKGESVSSAEPLVVTTSTAKPGFVRILATALDAEGKPVVNESKKKVVFDGGGGVHPETLRSVPEPADFDAYWAAQKATLAKTPLAVLEMKPLPENVPAAAAFDVKIACAGGAPVSGYFSKTKNAAPRSAGARITFHGYGVRSASRNDQQAADPKKPMLVLDINAHGIENGQPPEYYTNLQKTSLKNYAFSREENARPETAYFNGMVLRVLRALEFLKAQPEWDGKTLIVSGGSQGGWQALIAAGLDSDVSQCLAYKPWCCDLGGVTLGRLKGWRPDYTPVMDYFDPVNHAKRIRCDTVISSGLGDYVCPPSGITVLYNNIPAGVTKRLEYQQGATHGESPLNMVRHVVKAP
ncbi:MAG: acetyl xylan esterase [Rariglobus sp.]|jgi:cephalosporin-C deacetylase-like acetyl esterase|nr:acetyl xylan esterase [Rariglobus sp.]